MTPKFKEEQVTRSARAKEDEWFRQNEQELCESALQRLKAKQKTIAGQKANEDEASGK